MRVALVNRADLCSIGTAYSQRPISITVVFKSIIRLVFKLNPNMNPIVHAIVNPIMNPIVHLDANPLCLVHQVVHTWIHSVTHTLLPT